MVLNCFNKSISSCIVQDERVQHIYGDDFREVNLISTPRKTVDVNESLLGQLWRERKQIYKECVFLPGHPKSPVVPVAFHEDHCEVEHNDMDYLNYCLFRIAFSLSFA